MCVCVSVQEGAFLKSYCTNNHLPTLIYYAFVFSLAQSIHFPTIRTRSAVALTGAESFVWFKWFFILLQMYLSSLIWKPRTPSDVFPVEVDKWRRILRKTKERFPVEDRRSILLESFSLRRSANFCVSQIYFMIMNHTCLCFHTASVKIKEQMTVFQWSSDNT